MIGRLAAAAVMALGVHACGVPGEHRAARAPSTPPPATARPRPAPAVARAAPPYMSSVRAVTAADLPHSYHAGCPVGPDRLRLVRLRFWGFDARAHDGAVVVNATVTGQVARVFRRLYDARFPIRSVRPVDAYGGDDNRSMAADNTSGFNCRYAVAPGPHHWSAHAYGEAIDVNTVENPYVEGGQVRPPSGASYVDRSRLRPGMAVPGGVLVRAFAAEGWQWGGRWSTPDYQHFSPGGG